MTLSMTATPANGHLPTFQDNQVVRVANQRTPKDFAKARRHSWFVKIMRIVLPLAAITLTLTFATTVFFSISPLQNIAIESLELEDGRLIMNAPTMTGFNAKNQPYDVKAQRAIQDLSKPDVIDLEKLIAILPMEDKSKVNVTADFGNYDTNGETLKLRKNVVITGVRGMHIQLDDADIDVKSNSMTSSKPVKITSKDTVLTANSMRIENNGERISFSKNVKMIIQPSAINRTSASGN